MTEEKLIEKLKTQTEELWQTIQEAKKYNLIVHVGFNDSFVKPFINVSKTLLKGD